MIRWTEVYDALAVMRDKHGATPTEFKVSEAQLQNSLHATISSIKEVESLYRGLPKKVAGAVVIFQTPLEAQKGRWELVGKTAEGKEVMITGPY